MEFDFDVRALFDFEIIKLERSQFVSNEQSHWRLSYTPHNKELVDRFASVINKMGEASAKAQGLHHSVTTFNKIVESDQTLYLMKDDFNQDICRVIGILKIGRKKLFLQDLFGRQHEIIPTCVLDFYIHESYQRKGCGLKLFEYMLKDQNVAVDQLAIDRPSDKLLAFMKKHYSYLGNPVHQRNNFTVYQKIFSELTLISENNDYKFEELPKRRQRHSEPPAPNNWIRSTNNRHSYPNCEDLKSSSGSVASVVFGQRRSQAYDTKRENPPINILQRPEESISEYSDSFCRDVDSSMNIFGVPSPPNRYRLS